MLILYYTPRTCSLASHIALEDAGASYQLRRVDFATQQHCSEAFLRVNPKGRVPALVTPRGILTETPAILAFIAQSFPATRLAPLDDPFAFADMQRKVPQVVAACFDVIETRMFKGPWVLGDRYSIADAYLFTLARWMEGDGVDPRLFPAVLAHRTQMMELPNVAKAIAQEAAAA